MICVILGHINYGGYCYHIVYPFHMPLFFFISGWLLNEKYSLSTFFSRRATKLLRPYLIVSICVLITSSIMYFAGINYSIQYPRNPIDAFIRTFYASGSIYNRTPFQIGTVGAIWFLPALLLSSCFGSHRGRFLLTPPIPCAIIQPFISVVGGNLQCPGKPKVTGDGSC